MARQFINRGTVDNDNTGDHPKTFTGKIEHNFGELYNRFVVRSTRPTVDDDTNDGYVVGTYWVNSTTGLAYVATDVSVGAAQWASQDPHDELGYVSELYYPPEMAAAGAPAAVAPNVHYGVLIYLRQHVSVAGLGIRIGTGGGTFGKAAVYAIGQNGTIGAREAVSAAPFPTDAVANVFSAFAVPVTLKRGWHLLSSIYDGAPQVVGIQNMDSHTPHIIGAANATAALGSSGKSAGYTGVATYADGPPLTFGTAAPRNATTPCPLIVPD